MLFTNRVEAGRRLAERLSDYRERDPVVLGLPRGGVPVAGVVAETLDAPLDAIVIRKLGAPLHPEYAIGAIGEEGVRIVDPRAMSLMNVSERDLAAVERTEREELTRRAERFRQGRPRLDLTGKFAIVVDDGIATGSTAQAACQAARKLGAAEIVLAVPVAPPDWIERLGPYADELIAVATPEPFYAVGQWYGDFAQTSDEEVIEWLNGRARVVH